MKKNRRNRETLAKPVKLSSVYNFILISAILLICGTIILYTYYRSQQYQQQEYQVKEQEIQFNYQNTKQRQIIKTFKRTTPPQYTQGLVFKNSSTLIESSGLYGQSSIHMININEINKFYNNKALSNSQFGEGCDIINGKLYQLTWRERKINVYDVDTLNKIDEIDLDQQIQEGWGITHRYIDNQLQILISDGSNYIYIANEQFKVIKKIPIKYNDQRKTKLLNELEYANGILYANIYLDTIIVAIDLDKGQVINQYQFKDLKQLSNRQDRGECLNGIAYSKDTNTFFITGKYWPYIWEVRLQ